MYIHLNPMHTLNIGKSIKVLDIYRAGKKKKHTVLDTRILVELEDGEQGILCVTAPSDNNHNNAVMHYWAIKWMKIISPTHIKNTHWNYYKTDFNPALVHELLQYWVTNATRTISLKHRHLYDNPIPLKDNPEYTYSYEFQGTKY